MNIKITTAETTKWVKDYLEAMQFFKTLPADVVALYESFYKNGQLWIKSYYKNDKLDGEYLYFSDTGKIYEKS